MTRRVPSASLRTWIERQIADTPDDTSLGGWPKRLMKEHHVLLVHGNQAFLWYLAPTGELYQVDTDDIRQALEPETSDATVREVLEAAAANHPQLRELID
jgi:hypothetical protein